MSFAPPSNAYGSARPCLQPIAGVAKNLFLVCSLCYCCVIFIFRGRAGRRWRRDRYTDCEMARRRQRGGGRHQPVRLVLCPDRDVRAAAISGKGMGVVACRDLPPNSRLAYVGRIIDRPALQRLCERAKREPARRLTAYLMAEGRAGFYIDAHPRRRERTASWIAGLVNEPARGATANMIIGRQRLAHDNGLIRPVLITVRCVKAGDELTIKYGNGCTRAYTAGRAPAKPAWLRR